MKTRNRLSMFSMCSFAVTSFRVSFLSQLQALRIVRVLRLKAIRKDTSAVRYSYSPHCLKRKSFVLSLANHFVQQDSLHTCPCPSKPVTEIRGDILR